RVGLSDNGDQIPLDGGVKLNGRVGRWNLAALDVQTRDANTSAGFVPGTNLLASRVSYDLTDKFRIGTIFTHGDPGGVQSNGLLGFDAVWRTSTFRRNKNLFIGAWTARGEGDVGPGERQGWGFKIDYPNDLWDCTTSLNQYGEALIPDWDFCPVPARGNRKHTVRGNHGLRKTVRSAGFGRSSLKINFATLPTCMARWSHGTTSWRR
ncbi:MAG: hypothetical protein DMG64_20275, partial [Acidobacteria bacterium]